MTRVRLEVDLAAGLQVEPYRDNHNAGAQNVVQCAAHFMQIGQRRVPDLVEDDGRHACNPGDIVWLPNGTHLKYIATERTGYFYCLYPFDWAARQGTVEP